MKKNRIQNAIIHRLPAVLAAAFLASAALSGCGSAPPRTDGSQAIHAESSADSQKEGAEDLSSGEKKSLVFGDTTFNAENEESNIDPHSAYCGWACIRYGVGETLFKFSDGMELEPWIASGYKNIDPLTWEISIKDGVTFSNGKAVDAEAVKACIEDLAAVHERAAGDLMIDEILADGQLLTIRTKEEKPTLINYLCDPYGCIIDVEAGNENGIVTGTGPFIAKELVTDDHIKLVKNKSYWNGEPKIDEITVLTISDGDTLAFSLQNGDIDAAYGMAYASYPIFENDDYTFSSSPTSRAFFCQMNFRSPIMQDEAVRKAIALGIDKQGFVDTLLRGYGYVGTGAFPDSFSYGGQKLETEGYDPEEAKAELEEAGWIDRDGDGIREKDGQALSIRWISYPSRQELPLLAEYAHSTLKEIGIDVQLTISADHNAIVSEPEGWDLYAAAFVTCGTGDPAYFFTTHCLKDSVKNRGAYYDEELEELAAELNRTFDPEKRSQLAIQMQEEILDDNAFIFCSFLRMSMISKANVTGLSAHTCDYYELTADLDIS
ncbi:MAG: ABC transporter substrate-binding protein [Lachnospiraceae bacterium]|nr:ABC transporter substrate-binding protein [Lachnospiraceae bacterium]